MIRLLTVLFLLVPFFASAQIIPTLQIPVEIEVVPAAPAPGANVLLRAQNVPGGASASYTWTINGEVVDQGIGRDAIVFTAGGVGSVTAVELSIRQGDTFIGEVVRTVRPAELDLVWEAETSIPPFYDGRPLPNGDSTVRVSAVPNVVVDEARISPSNLVYQWFVNGSKTPYRSGYGLSTITLTPPLFGSEFTVRGVAQTRDGRISVARTVAIAPRDPEILIYEDAPLLGLRLDSEVQQRFDLFADEVTVLAFPLFINNLNQTQYRWNINNDTVESTGESDRELTLRRTGTGSGQYSIGISLKTENSFYEQADRSFLLSF